MKNIIDTINEALITEAVLKPSKRYSGSKFVFGNLAFELNGARMFVDKVELNKKDKEHNELVLKYGVTARTLDVPKDIKLTVSSGNPYQKKCLNPELLIEICDNFSDAFFDIEGAPYDKYEWTKDFKDMILKRIKEYKK